jgi:D-psicose/D-tagatose/L-ribulose 3-epimerase
MKFGINLFLWTTAMEDDMQSVLVQIKESGFDFVEVPIFDVSDLKKWQRWSAYLDGLGLDRVAVTLCTAEHNLIHPDAAMRQAAIERNKQAVACAQALGASILTGPFHSALNVFSGQKATAQEWDWSVAGMREIAEHASLHGITLGMEYLNRFENYLLTCTDDLVRYVEAVNHPNCQLMFDTFHANIEEKNLGNAIRRCAPYNIHVQISENDRSTPGQGNVDWTGVFKALAETNYQGGLSIEAFGLTPTDLAAAAHIYRPMFESPQQLITDGLAFMKLQWQLAQHNRLAVNQA